MIPLPRPVKPLHLYRHLLREASYFPPICRPYLVARIQDRFRTTRAKLVKLDTLAQAKNNQELAHKSHQLSKRALWQGSRQLKGLRASNLGDVVRLRRTLRHAFGRLGKRRRELLAAFVQRDAPADSTVLEAHLDKMDGLVAQGKGTEGEARSNPQGPGTDDKGRRLPVRVQDKWDTSKLLAYVKSQIRHFDVASPAAWSRSRFTNANPETGNNQENIWGDPLPLRRRRLRTENWWKNAANKIMPPVSRAEWDTIAAACRGELPSGQWRMLPRRPVARSLAATPEGEPPTREPRDWTAYATTPVSFLERPKKKSNWRLTGEKDDGPWSQQQRQRSRPPTGRNMRRELVHIWQSTAYVEEHPTTQAKKFHWGNPSRFPAAGSSQSWFFEAADEKAPVRLSRGSKAKKSQDSEQDETPAMPV